MGESGLGSENVSVADARKQTKNTGDDEQNTLGGYPMGHLVDNKSDMLARVKRIAGQVAAVERGIERGAACADILHLVAAVRGAVNGLLDEIVVDHLDQHVAKPGLSDAERAKGADELMTVIRRYVK